MDSVFIFIKELKEGHNIFKLFCNQVKEKYGPKICVPNMHLMLLITDCVLNYGPVYAICCFGFERFNGIMGK